MSIKALKAALMMMIGRECNASLKETNWML